MNDDLERLIRQAQERKAFTIDDAAETRAAIPVRAAALRRRHRSGMVLGGSVAVLVAIAVTVPMVFFSPDRTFPAASASADPTAPLSTPSDDRIRLTTPSPTPSDPGVPRATAAVPTDGAGNTPVRYTATWLPAGYKELRRNAYTTEVSRTWATTTSDVAKYSVSRKAVELSSTPATMSEMDPEREQPDTTTAPVDVNGAAGVYRAYTKITSMTVTWPVGDIVLQVHSTDPALTKEDVLRIARSVQPDPTVTNLPMRVGWTPTGYVNQGFIFFGSSPTAYDARITFNAGVTTTNPIGSSQFHVDIGQTTVARSGGTDVMINGHSGRIFGPTEHNPGMVTDLIVEAALDNGQILTVTANWATGTAGIDEDTLLQVARSVEFVGGDTGWIGQTP
ncbi:hypothetical protein GCM10022251_77940 [Phytohabitans flavus]|uniref:Uncharacterized protein n=1 Tax=Phytohabitans flavus TaxID=1076124 RepID=A0A6F8XNI6_9ACTN|nr:hypothetical protein [Phytohabitans flavus]BCB75394.1 hypothetical protein Pflav_018040 [Phytohabitans flavus]